MAGIYTLADVKDYFKSKLLGRDEWTISNQNRIEECYDLISNPFNRVNGKDKQWVAYVTQATEDTTVIDAIEEIIEKQGLSRSKKDISDTVNEVGDFFVSLKVQFKPRIPFYILVLDKLIP